MASDIGTVAGIAALVTSIGGAAGAYIKLRKSKPEVTQIIIDAAEDLVVLQRSYIEKMEARVAATEMKIGELEVLVGTLRRENISLRAERTKMLTRIRELEHTAGVHGAWADGWSNGGDKDE